MAPPARSRSAASSARRGGRPGRDRADPGRACWPCCCSVRVAVFIVLVTRVDAARREQRLAAFRLAGATRWQTGAAGRHRDRRGVDRPGSLLGWLGYQLVRPLIARLRQAGRAYGSPLRTSRCRPPRSWWSWWRCRCSAVVATLVALHRVQITPLGVQRRRAAPAAPGVAARADRGRDRRPPGGRPPFAGTQPRGGPAAVAGARMASLLSIVVGLVLAGPWVCMWISRGIARLSRRATTLIAARRIAANPYAASRAVIGSPWPCSPPPPSRWSRRRRRPRPAVALAPGVVAIHVLGAPDEARRARCSPTTRSWRRAGTQRSLVVACADLARVTDRELSAIRPSGTKPPSRRCSGRATLSSRAPATTRRRPAADQHDPRADRRHARGRGTAAHEGGRHDAARAHPLGPRRCAGRPADRRRALRGRLLRHRFTLPGRARVRAAGRGLQPHRLDGRRPDGTTPAVRAAAGLRGRPRELRRLALLETAVPLVVTVLGGLGTVLLMPIWPRRRTSRCPGRASSSASGRRWRSRSPSPCSPGRC